MTTPPAFDADRMVLEIEHCGHAVPPWRWFEIDLDHITVAGLQHDVPQAITGARVSAMTRHHQAEPIAALLARDRTRHLTHLQFEATGNHSARTVATLAWDQGLVPLPARHLDQPPDDGELARLAGQLAGLGTPLIKIAYPAPLPAHVDAAVQLLTRWDHTTTALALIPMGTRSGRAAAHAAGSRLMWVPPWPQHDRWGPSDHLPLPTGPASNVKESLL
ncbi:hypothetical protein I5Q34_32535 [Streptomyces sp. AV19]|uniref:hypothetical protein n=1 Tax=Streptomyces sp. AV19 TaxID=2793068 RepID=UPI0018FEBEDF|nr:hypothetical protein [Streptomyces sp. AV19]MBH1938934.1 hypothetical protein [Streptomyces sp. AV19]MDG4536816.1 hypothetical protein [Streptomyces sp. AV19]